MSASLANVGSRRCSKPSCSKRAVATLTYVYADSTAVLGPLATFAEPHCYDLCEDHAARMTAPRGWDVVRLAPDPEALMSSLGDLDPNDGDAMANIQSMFSDPMVLMGAVRSAEQAAMAPVLDARVAAISGYIDYAVDAVSSRLLGATSPIAEAVRRRRAEYGTDAQLIERLLGLTTTRAQQQRGRTFINGVVEREGAGALPRMLSSAESMPTPNEVDAPGLWLARLEIQ